MRWAVGAAMDPSVSPVPPATASAPPTPMWVKALGIAVLLAILGFVVFHFLGNAPTGH